MNQVRSCLVVQALKSEYVDVNLKGITVSHLITGIGKVNASLRLTKQLMECRPDFVVNIGSAGALHHEVGTIIVCDRFTDRDMVQLSALDVCSASSQVQFRPFFSNIFQFDTYGTCCTGDNFVTIYEGYEDVFDMEAFAYSRVCKELDIPFIAIKYVTDKIGQNTVKQWSDKLDDARRDLTAFVAAVVTKQFRPAQVMSQ